MEFKRNILITGGAGFIGSHLVRRFVLNYPEYHIINLDALTYAGNLDNLTDIEEKENYTFVKGDVRDYNFLISLFKKYQIDGVFHLAAESHVDRSISNPLSFIETNIIGTYNLLNAAKEFWADFDKETLFYHISTDEVFGSLGDTGLFDEEHPYDPRSPYSASKASSDHLVRAYFHTYQLPVVISNCSNNYGSHQFPEKLIPLMINNIKLEKPLPVYGTGENVRDWLWVDDHVRAMDIIFHKGKSGETYAIGGNNEWTNLELVTFLCRKMDEKLGRPPGTNEKLITFVSDRKGHDLRYAIDSSKITRELGWTPSVTFEEGLDKTIDWYLTHSDWLDKITSGVYKDYYKKHYS